MDELNKIFALEVAQAYLAKIEKVNSTGVSHKEWRDFNYTMRYNLTDWPAATVRCGTTSDDLPIGVQVIVKPWHDYVALAVAEKLEQLFSGWQEPILC